VSKSKRFRYKDVLHFSINEMDFGNRMKSKVIHKRLFIKIIALAVTIAFLCQNVVLANPNFLTSNERRVTSNKLAPSSDAKNEYEDAVNACKAIQDQDKKPDAVKTVATKEIIESGTTAGGAWFGHPTYMRWLAWWIEPLLSYSLSVPAYVLLIYNSNEVWTALVSAVIFWLPHALRGKVAFSRDVISLTVGTALAGIPLFALGLWHPATLVALGILTAYHCYKNWNAIVPVALSPPGFWRRMVFHGLQVIRVGVFAVTLTAVSTSIIFYNWAALSGRGFSITHALKTLPPIVTVVTETKKSAYPTVKIDLAITAGKADRLFWESKFSNYPADVPLSALITPERIRELHSMGQLNHLFNALRAQPELIYRYLAEIPKNQHQEFARYFATLKPGTRQQIFSIFYKRLRNDLLTLESGRTVKEMVFGDYQKVVEQANRMERLYSTLVQICNRINPLKPGELPDKAVAPPSIIGFTKDRTISNLEKMFEEEIKAMADKGYKVTLPAPDKVNVSEMAALIGYYFSDAQVLFLRENYAAQLLQWAMRETDPSNPLAHLITDQELLRKAMLLCADPQNKTVDLFKVIATIGHYYKAMARNPDLILGGPEARGLEDGADFIRKMHDRISLTWALDPSISRTVDENGQPVIFWRPVDADGNDSIPKGQRVGILWYTTEDDSYHAWNFLLTALYCNAKSFDEISGDFYEYSLPKKTISDEPVIARLLTKQKTAQEIISNAFATLSSEKHLWTDDTSALPVYYKYAQVLEIDEDLLTMFGFTGAKGKIKSEEYSKNIFAEVGKWIYQDLVGKGSVLLIDQPEIIENSQNVSKRTIMGGRTVESYIAEITAKRERLGSSSLEEWLKKDPVGCIKYLLAAKQIDHLKDQEWVGIGNDALKRMIQQPESIELLRFLSSCSHNKGIRYIVAGNSNTPVDVLKRLASDLDLYVKCAVAGNSNTPVDVLRQLVSDPRSSVRQGVAFNSNTPVDVLERLASDPRSSVRQGVAFNSNTPVDVLKRLVSDPRSSVRRGVAFNSNTPADALRQLVSDPDLYVKCDVAGHSNTPVDVLIQLASDSVESVRKIAKATLEEISKKSLPQPPKTPVITPVIEKFAPLTQPSTTKLLGEKIGDDEGLVFDLGKAQEPKTLSKTIVDALKAEGITVADNAQDNLTIIQRYFSFIRARAPDMTRDIGDYQIEFRKNVLHYATIEGSKIFIDIALLNQNSKDLLPFLTFVLGHEGSHALDQDVDEKAAQEMDWVRFQAFSKRHQQSVLNVLRLLGAEKSYVESLTGPNTKLVKALEVVRQYRIYSQVVEAIKRVLGKGETKPIEESLYPAYSGASEILSTVVKTGLIFGAILLAINWSIPFMITAGLVLGVYGLAKIALYNKFSRKIIIIPAIVLIMLISRMLLVVPADVSKAEVPTAALVNPLQFSVWGVRQVISHTIDSFVKSFIKDLEDGSVQVRKHAARALGKIKGRRAINPLIKALGDGSHVVQKEAALALVSIGNPVIISLKNKLDNIWIMTRANRKIVEWTPWILGELQTKDALKFLSEIIFNEGNSQLQFDAVNAVCKYDTEDAARLLFKFLNVGWNSYHVGLMDRGYAPRINAIYKLGKLKYARAVPLFLRINATSRDLELGNAASGALDMIGKAGLDYHIQMLDSQNDIICTFAALYLAKIGDSSAVKPLIKTALNNPYWQIQMRVAEALGKIGDKKGVGHLLDMLKKYTEMKTPIGGGFWKKNILIVERIITALGKLEDSRAINPIVEFYRRTGIANIELQEAAVVALCRLALAYPDIGIAEKKIIPLLENHIEGSYGWPCQKGAFKKINKKVLPKFIINLIHKRNEIMYGVFSLGDIVSIYTNDEFIEKTKDLDFANQFSIARAIKLTLQRFELGFTAENIEKALPIILDAIEIHSKRIMFDKNTNLIIMSNHESVFHPALWEEFAGRFGVKHIKSFVGGYHKKKFLSEVEKCPKNGVVIINGHYKHLNSVSLDRKTLITSQELASALKARAAQNNGILSDMFMVVVTCKSAKVAVNTINLLKESVEKGEIKDLPVFVSACNRFTNMPTGKFVDSLRRATRNKTEVRIADIISAEKFVADKVDFAFFFPLLGELKEQFVKAFPVIKIDKRKIAKKSLIHPYLSMIDGFDPLTQPGATEPLGEKIGDDEGLVFNLGKAQEPKAVREEIETLSKTIVDALTAKGIPVADTAQDNLTIMQRYFRFIRIRAPDTTKDIRDYQIEFRKNVRHYATIEGTKIFVDIALLNQAPKDLLPFLTFVLGHEGSHALDQVVDEKAAQEMDWVRFQAFSKRHQQSVLNVLRLLGAEKSYVESLTGPNPKLVKALEAVRQYRIYSQVVDAIKRVIGKGETKQIEEPLYPAYSGASEILSTVVKTGLIFGVILTALNIGLIPFMAISGSILFAVLGGYGLAKIALYNKFAQKVVITLVTIMLISGIFPVGSAGLSNVLRAQVPAATVSASPATVSKPMQDRIKELIKQLGDEDWQIRKTAEEELIEFGELVIPSIIKACSDNNNYIVLAARRVLAKIGKLAPKIKLLDLIKLLDNENAWIRRFAAKTLDKLNWEPGTVQEKISYLIAKNKERSWDELIEIGKPAVRPIIEVLGDNHPFVCEDATYTLIGIGKPAVESLLKFLEDKKGQENYAYHRRAIAVVLGEIGDERAVDILVETLLNKNEFLGVRQSAVKTLDKLNWEPGTVQEKISYHIAKNKKKSWDELIKIGKPAVRPIIEVLGNRDVFVCRNATYALIGIGPPAIDILIEALKDKNENVRRYVTYALLGIGQPAVEPLRNALNDKNAEVRKAAAYALGEFRDIKAVKPLREILKDEEEDTPEDPKAIKLLIKSLSDKDSESDVVVDLIRIGEPALSQLIKAFVDEKNITVRGWIVATIRILDIKAKEAKERRYNFFIEILKNKKAAAKLRADSAHALGEIKDERAIKPLIKLLGDKNVLVRIYAAVALGKFKNEKAFESLCKLLEHKNSFVRLSVARLLNELITKHFPEAEDKKKIAPIIKTYLQNNILKGKAVTLTDSEAIARVFVNLMYRKEEIEEGALNPVDIVSIYSNREFYSKTKDLGFANQYSVARAIDLTIKRFGLDISDENIEKVLPFIIEVTEKFSKRVVLNKNAHLIIVVHSEYLFDPLAIADFARKRFGVRDENIQVFRGTEDKEYILQAIRECPPNTTIWFGGHGGPSHFWLENGQVGREISDHLDAISYKELANSLIYWRAGNNNYKHSDLNIIIESCFSADFIVETLDSLVNSLSKGDIKSLPMVVATTNRGATSKGIDYSSLLLDSLLLATKNKLELPTDDPRRALIVNDIFDAEEYAVQCEDFAFFFPMNEGKFQKLKEVLGVSEKDIKELVKPAIFRFGSVNIHPFLPTIDRFDPLTQPGAAKLLGEKIGDDEGLVFDLGKDQEPKTLSKTIVNALTAKGIPVAANAQDNLTTIQRYFRFIRARVPDTTKDIKDYQIEFRKNVRHYATIEGTKIFIDIALLNQDPKDLLPFLTFVLGHEGSHALEQVVDEKAAQEMDIERFKAFSGVHQQAVVRVLAGLGVNREYLEKLLSAAFFGSRLAKNIAKEMAEEPNMSTAVDVLALPVVPAEKANRPKVIYLTISPDIVNLHEEIAKRAQKENLIIIPVYDKRYAVPFDYVNNIAKKYPNIFMKPVEVETVRSEVANEPLGVAAVAYANRLLRGMGIMTVVEAKDVGWLNSSDEAYRIKDIVSDRAKLLEVTPRPLDPKKNEIHHIGSLLDITGKGIELHQRLGKKFETMTFAELAGYIDDPALKKQFREFVAYLMGIKEDEVAKMNVAEFMKAPLPVTVPSKSTKTNYSMMRAIMTAA